MLSRSNPKRVTLSYEELFQARSSLPPYVPCPSPATAKHGFCPMENVPPVQSVHTPRRKHQQQQQQQNLSLDSPLTDIISQINSNLNRAHSLLTPSKQPTRTTNKPNNAKPPQHPPSAAPQPPLLLQKQISKLQKTIDLLVDKQTIENNKLRTELTEYKHRPPAMTSSNSSQQGLPKPGTFSTIGNLLILVFLVFGMVVGIFMKLFLQFEEEEVVY